SRYPFFEVNCSRVCETCLLSFEWTLVPLRILTLTRGILRLRCAPLRMTSCIALASAQADDRVSRALALLFPYSSLSSASTYLHKVASPERPNLRLFGTAGRLSLA